MIGSALADILNLTPTRISQLTKDGIFTRHSSGGYDLEECVRVYCRLSKTGPTTAAMAAAKLRRAEADARLAESHAAAAEGRTIAVSEVEQIMAEIGAAVAGAMKSMRQSLPEHLAGLNAEKIAVILEADIRRVMALIYDSHLTSFKGCHDHSTDR